MIITCGVSHTDSRIEAIFKARREEGGFETSGGCGRDFDLENTLSQSLMYRCVECGRWLCKPCITAHFAESTPPAPDSGARPRPVGGQQEARERR